MSRARRIGVRWTIGDVNPRGFEALRLSVWGARRLFGPDAAYAICVNTIPLDRARELTGDLPEEVVWRVSTAGDLPRFLREYLDEGMSEGVSWKFAPLQMFPDRYELALDNDCILWKTPAAIRRWLSGGASRRCVLAEDVRTCFGQFEHLCGPEPRNSGIRGLPPGFDLEGALREVLRQCPVKLTSELDEQGLQVAAISLERKPLVVSVEDVTICSPFPPHVAHLGRCGAHFVGLNARRLPWEFDGRPAAEHIEEHWLRRRDALYARVGVGAPCAGGPKDRRSHEVAVGVH